MTPFLFVLCAIAIDAMCAFVLVFFAIRGEQVYRNRTIIICAISRYKLANPELFGRYPVDYADMRGYKATYARFWDSGYKHILPKEKYALIEPYIKEDDAYLKEP